MNIYIYIYIKPLPPLLCLMRNYRKVIRRIFPMYGSKRGRLILSPFFSNLFFFFVLVFVLIVSFWRETQQTTTEKNTGHSITGYLHFNNYKSNIITTGRFGKNLLKSIYFFSLLIRLSCWRCPYPLLKVSYKSSSPKISSGLLFYCFLRFGSWLMSCEKPPNQKVYSRFIRIIVPAYIDIYKHLTNKDCAIQTKGAKIGHIYNPTPFKQVSAIQFLTTITIMCAGQWLGQITLHMSMLCVCVYVCGCGWCVLSFLQHQGAVKYYLRSAGLCLCPDRSAEERKGIKEVNGI